MGGGIDILWATFYIFKPHLMKSHSQSPNYISSLLYFLHRIAEVTVGDETGTITLRARNGQVDFLVQGLRETEEDETKPLVVVVRNAGVAMYKGHMRLIVNKWGKLSRYFPLPPSSSSAVPPFPSSFPTSLLE